MDVYSQVVMDKVWSRVVINDEGCWEYMGPLLPTGYAHPIYVSDGIRPIAHRWSFEYFTGEKIPPGMTLDHICHQIDGSCEGGKTCRHRRCLCPDHLRIETPLENAARRVRNKGWAPEKKRTHCIRGHEFTEENTRYYGKLPHRTCRKCDKIREENRRAR